MDKGGVPKPTAAQLLANPDHINPVTPHAGDTTLAAANAVVANMEADGRRPEIAYAPVSAPSKVGSDEVRCCVCGSVRHWNMHTNARH